MSVEANTLAQMDLGGRSVDVKVEGGMTLTFLTPESGELIQMLRDNGFTDAEICDPDLWAQSGPVQR